MARRCPVEVEVLSCLLPLVGLALAAGPSESVRSDDTVTVRGRARRKAEKARITARHSLTISPFRATWPAFHGRYEKRLTPHLGADVAVGFGSWNPLSARVVNALTATEMPDVSMREVEGGLSAYVGGRFARGMQLGMTVRRQVATSEVVWGVDPTTGASTTTNFEARATTVGPHLGLKRVGKRGLTFQARVGGGWMFADAEANTELAVADSSALLPMTRGYSGPMVFGNMGIGYSF